MMDNLPSVHVLPTVERVTVTTEKEIHHHHHHYHFDWNDSACPCLFLGGMAVGTLIVLVVAILAHR